jgi:hypothetical protein
MNAITLPLRVPITDEYLPPPDFPRKCHIPYSSITKAIRAGDLTQYLIDDKVQLKVVEVLAYFAKKRTRIPIAPPEKTVAVERTEKSNLFD